MGDKLKKENELLKAQKQMLKSVIGELQNALKVEELEYNDKFRKMYIKRADDLIKVVNEIEEEIKASK
ncbi:hypothetical protein J32TS6_05110 [Virgibacillus pantothenticus]|uniref:hypothetical protein n=1 Tax=Virgibacillus pantothenticus TaxID=1473 RepID=UPI001B18B271|nr:hypothetical protein [Virgibacillus pantothenticus]GIP61956.1 hypothetical protein J32TS6_05110 [Virgibacillus pantothenticus]